MSFAVLPPELNSWQIFAGPGSAPMLAAAAAWDGLAAELSSAAASFSTLTCGLTGSAWQGPASAAMANAATPYLGWLSAAASQAEQTAAQARLAAAAFEAAQAATVDPAIIAANRAQLVWLATTNLLGQNAPAIAAAEAAYEQMWAQDVAAMFDYHAGASAAVSALTPFTRPLQGLVGAAAGGTAATIQQTIANTFRDLGFANIGEGNVGNANVGNFNFGSGNVGSGNVGYANIGSGNFGFGNVGPALTAALNNIGFGNTGNGNRGIGLTGTGLSGFGGLNSGTGNVGLFNSGTGNVGIGNSGTGNWGIGNSGNSYNTGIGNSGDANTGFFNAGIANTGIGNSGSYNTGIFNPGSSYTGGFNLGRYNTGYFNSGNYDTGVANFGNVDTGAFISGNFSNGVLWRGDFQGLVYGQGPGFGNSTTIPSSGFFNSGAGSASGFFNSGANNSRVARRASSTTPAAPYPGSRTDSRRSPACSIAAAHGFRACKTSAPWNRAGRTWATSCRASTTRAS
jgi:PPE-repeat protein